MHPSRARVQGIKARSLPAGIATGTMDICLTQDAKLVFWITQEYFPTAWTTMHGVLTYSSCPRLRFMIPVCYGSYIDRRPLSGPDEDSRAPPDIFDEVLG